MPKRTWQASITPNPLLSSFKIIGQIVINIFNSLTILVHNRFLLSHLKVIFYMLLSLSSYSLFEMLNIDFFNIYKINIILSRHYLFFLICFLLFFSILCSSSHQFIILRNFCNNIVKFFLILLINCIWVEVRLTLGTSVFLCVQQKH